MRNGERSGVVRRSAGFSYLAMLVFVAVTALATASSLKVGVQWHRRLAEEQLLDSGLRLVRALESYAQLTPSGDSPHPSKMEDLLRDPRYPGRVIRHLRRIEPDPLTGQADWVEVRTADGRRITGFHSRSDNAVSPREFPPPFQDFAELRRYDEWLFVAGLGE